MWLRGFRRGLRHGRQGGPAAPPRPADLRHDVRRADHAAAAVRLRHRHRSAPPADRRALGRPQPITRTILSALGNTGYSLHPSARTEAEANALLQRGEVQFVVTIPSDFTRRLVRGERAQILVDADATDPWPPPIRWPRRAGHRAGAGARPGRAARSACAPRPTPSNRAAAPLQPGGQFALNIVPGLLAVILTMTMVMMTALAVTRERERGTMENLLAMPVRPIEVMIGKIVPYIVIGSVQVAVILLVARLLFESRATAASRCSASARRCSSPSTWPSASPSRP